MTTFAPPPHPARVLTLDTSTDRLSVTVGHPGDAPLAQHQGPGGAQASATLIPQIQALLAQVGWPLATLDLIAYGSGPGSFTGLRTACAVVQGLAVAARPGGVPVLPIPTLLAVAEAARPALPALQAGDRVLAVLDARMDELYVAEAVCSTDGHLTPTGPAWLSAPEALATPDGWPLRADAAPPVALVGNALALYGARLPAAWHNLPQHEAWPTADALLRLVPPLWASGTVVDAAQAQPLYVRDKVAQTTEERERIKAAQAGAQA